ncbi:hypothetical protein [Arcticibacter sp. MXS-1]|uniref:hypothetical protein n=1 Tax=Arcticibacter sp. MXS-1 TaxID=3341726 RepID=UPI0035A8263C
MKKILYFTLLVVGLSVKGYADDKIKSEKKDAGVSYFAQNNFLSKYQNAQDVNWTVTPEFQKASFSLEGVKMAAFFDINGDFIATTQYVDASKLPARSKSRIQKLYKEYKIEEVVRYDLDAADESHFDLLTGKRFYNTVYFASLKNSDQKMVLKITPDGEVSFLKEL